MNEKQAIQASYSFSGFYSRDKEEAKERAAEERAKGNKAMVVTKVSKGRVYNTTGYSVYLIESETNKQAKIKANRQAHIKNLEAQLQKAKAEVIRLNTLLAELQSEGE